MQGLWNMLVMVQDMCSPWWGMITTINSVYSNSKFCLFQPWQGGWRGELCPWLWVDSFLISFASCYSSFLWMCIAVSFCKIRMGVNCWSFHHWSAFVCARLLTHWCVLKLLAGLTFGWWAPTQEAEMFILFLARSQIPQGLTFIMKRLNRGTDTFTVIPKSCLGVKSSWFWQG